MSESTSSASAQDTLLVFLIKLIGLLPLGASRFLGALIGRSAALLRTSFYRVTLRNIELCFPDMTESQRKELAVASVCETAKLTLETPVVWTRDYSWLEQKIVSVENRELLDAAKEKDEGLIILAPHAGNWEVLGYYIANLIPITNLYQPPGNSALEKVMRESREKTGASIVPTNRRGIASLVKILKQGGYTGILPDQTPDLSGGDFAPFYGVPALTMTLVHNLRKRTNCQLVAGLAKRVPGGFAIEFMTVDEGMYSDDEQESLAALNRTVEKVANRDLKQYQWEYKRYRRQPEGVANPYKVLKRK